MMRQATDFQPKYQQLATWVRTNIKEGTWPVGAPIPSEMQLVEQFSLSRNTVREALRELELSGHIYRLHGKGSYVSSIRLNQLFNNLTSFSEDILAAGMIPDHRTIKIRRAKASEAVASLLKIPSGNECLLLHRLLLADKLPFIVVKSFFSAQWIEMSGIQLTVKTLGSRSLYEFLASEYGIVFTRASITARALRATGEDARLLEIPRNSPVLATTRLSFTSDNEPRELTFGVGHPDRHQWTMMVYRNVDSQTG